jgi:pyridoxamine 5'-phosphate oxidase
MPDAMALATSSAGGAPSARMVILRGLDKRGLAFFTDRGSAKGRELEANPQASLLFHWHLPRHRQVRVSGRVEGVSDEDADRYWESRRPGVRWALAASRQSEVVGSRAELEARLAEVSRAHPCEASLARPPRWGGYRVRPEQVELWEEREDLLHDRLRCGRVGGAWVTERLSP